MKKRRAILFDLDGTLLPQDIDEFTKAYFQSLYEMAAGLGYEFSSLVDCVWKGTEAMVKNDGSVPNDRRFWSTFAQLQGEQVYDQIPAFDRFYREGFRTVVRATQPTPLAKEAVALAHARAERVILATNPIFPREGVKTKLSWIDLGEEDFDLITTYENSGFCKPNPRYYLEILDKFGLRPEECLLVGNDTGEDVAPAARIGLPVYLVTDCLIDRGGVPEGTPQGSLSDLLDFLRALPEA